jgi:TPR repeat protein
MVKWFTCLLLLVLVPAHADQATDQRFSQTLYLQPYSKLRQKAEQGDAQAQYDLAYLYYKADSDPSISGVNQSDHLAAQWYRRAALQGHSSAQYNMAVLHLRGDGVERDAISAYSWLLLARENGHGASESLMAELDGILNEEQVEEAKRRAVQLGSGQNNPS